MSRSSIAAAILAAALFLPTSLPARAGTIDLTTITCAELTEVAESKSDQDHTSAAWLLTWMAGYHATEEQGTAVDFDALKKDVENTVEFCKSNPGIGVYTASEKFMGENATEHSGEAIDLATIKCEKVIDAANKNEDGLNIIMMWLAGYYASYAQDKIIDFKKLETESYSIGKECAENRQNGLVTVADKYMQRQ